MLVKPEMTKVRHWLLAGLLIGVIAPVFANNGKAQDTQNQKASDEWPSGTVIQQERGIISGRDTIIYGSVTYGLVEDLKLKNPGQRELSLESLQIIAGSTSIDAITQIFGLPNATETWENCYKEMIYTGPLGAEPEELEEKEEVRCRYPGEVQLTKVTYRVKDGYVSRLLIDQDNQKKFDELSFKVGMKFNQSSKLWNVPLKNIYTAFSGDWYPPNLFDENPDLAFGTSDGNRAAEAMGGCEFTGRGHLTIARMNDRIFWPECHLDESNGNVTLGIAAECVDCDWAWGLHNLDSELFSFGYPYCRKTYDGFDCDLYGTYADAKQYKHSQQINVANDSVDAETLKAWLSTVRVTEFSSELLADRNDFLEKY